MIKTHICTLLSMVRRINSYYFEDNCDWFLSSQSIVFIQILTPDTLNVLKYDILV